MIAPLYVRRNVLNADEICAFYEKHGLSPRDPDKWHVTICYSKSPVNWEHCHFDLVPWQIAAQGREHALFGPSADKLVLQLTSRFLQECNEYFVDRGAQNDWAYRPHVTIADTGNLSPRFGRVWGGPISLGEEIARQI